MNLTQSQPTTDEILALQKFPAVRYAFGLSDEYNPDKDDIRPELEAKAYVVKLTGWEPSIMPFPRYTVLYYIFTDNPGAPLVIGINRDSGKMENITEGQDENTLANKISDIITDYLNETPHDNVGSVVDEISTDDGHAAFVEYCLTKL